MTALSEIEKLAINTAKKAQEESIDLAQKVDALKALNPYYALLKKAKMKEPIPDETGSLADLASQIHEADHGPSNGLHDRTGKRN